MIYDYVKSQQEVVRFDPSFEEKLNYAYFDGKIVVCEWSKQLEGKYKTNK